MVLEFVDKHQVLGQGCTCEGHRVLGSVKRGVESPAMTENTTAWGLLKLLVADRIASVSGRIDAPFGAEPAQFGVKRENNRRG